MAWTTVLPKVIPINQPTSSTCWYVCLQMLFVWKGKDPKDILRLLNADPEIYADYWMDNGVSPSNCRQIARALGMSCAGDGEADADVLANALATHGPYWVAGEWIKGSPHVVVVTGVNPASGKNKTGKSLEKLGPDRNRRSAGKFQQSSPALGQHLRELYLLGMIA